MKTKLSRGALLIGAAALLSFGVACGGGTTGAKAAKPTGEGYLEVGAGYVTTVAPKDRFIAIDATGKRMSPKVTDDFRGPPTSNNWWSSIIFQHDPKEPYSLPIYAHPLTFRAQAEGLGVGYPNKPSVAAREYMYRHEDDLVIGLEGLSAAETKTARYSDWDVTAEWRDGAGALRVTIAHGVPFAYAETDGQRAATVTFQGDVTVFKDQGATVGVEVDGKRYGLFAPAGSWQASGSKFTSTLGGKKHFSVGLLPDSSPESLDEFARSAFAFVRGTTASWELSGSTLRTKFEVETELVEPCGSPGNDADSGTCERVDEPLLALYRHQWRHSDAKVEDAAYVSPRGEMKLLRGSSFTTSLDASGFLPVLPASSEDAADDLRPLIDQIRGKPFFPKGLSEKPDHDAYWDGKSLGRLSTAAQLADVAGDVEAREEFLDAVQGRLEDWFDGQAPRYFYYDDEWKTLIAFPDSYGSAAQLNDHHFHYGYYIVAASTVARFRPEWVKKYGEMVELLIRDAASPSADDERFPRLRFMDVYAGHSWANGPAQFIEGNNEEASSEDINFSYGVAMWGAETGNDELRDLGLFLYATQVSAVEQYWFDVDDQVFPKKFDHPTVAMVWGAGGKYDTWFDQDPIMIHGINYLPFTGASLYLGRHPEYVKKNFGVMVERSFGKITTWRDYALMFAVLGDAEDAWDRYSEDTLFVPEFGNTHALTQHFMTTVREFGHVDATVQSSTPFSAAFKKGQRRTLVAYNPGSKSLKVKFSTGDVLSVAPNAVATKIVSTEGGKPEKLAAQRTSEE